MAEISAQSGAKQHSTGLLHVVTHAIGDLLLRYRRHQTMHELAGLDDHLLEDIGVRRTDLSSKTLSEGSRMERDLHMPRHQIG